MHGETVEFMSKDVSATALLLEIGGKKSIDVIRNASEKARISRQYECTG